MQTTAADRSGTSRKQTWILQSYYLAIQVSGIIILSSISFLLHRFPETFLFFGPVAVSLALVIGLLTFHIILFVLYEMFKKKVFFTVSRYIWTVFFAAVIYNSGGVESELLFLLFFPLLVSVVDLDQKATRAMGIVATVLFGLLIFLPSVVPVTVQIIAKHIFRTITFGVIAYFMYKIVKETLRQKFEKEEAKRKFLGLIELDKAKSDFLTVAHHQLRTPLSAARWGMENLLLSNNVAPQTRRVMQSVSERLERANSIVNEMLKTAEIDAGGFIIQPKEFSISRLVREIVRELEYASKEREVDVAMRLAGDYSIEADEKMLRAALTNIIDNAIRYSPKGKVMVSLYQNADDMLHVVVADTGIGIIEEDKKFIFDRFFRGSNAIALDPNQSGVGLYVTKKIVERHGGDLSIDSSAQRGTVVTVTLPKKNGTKN